MSVIENKIIFNIIIIIISNLIKPMLSEITLTQLVGNFIALLFVLDALQKVLNSGYESDRFVKHYMCYIEFVRANIASYLHFIFFLPMSQDNLRFCELGGLKVFGAF